MLLQFRPIGTFKNNFALALMHLHCQFQSLELGNLSIDGSELLKIRKKWKKIPRAQLYKKYPWHYLTINLLHSYIQFVKKIHTLVNLWFGWKIFAFREAEVKNPRIFGWIKKNYENRIMPGVARESFFEKWKALSIANTQWNFHQAILGNFWDIEA